jgi:hypothetical protein
MRNNAMLHSPRRVLRAGINRVRSFVGADPLTEKATVGTELKQAGQIVVIFAVMLTVMIGLVGIALDTTYAWRQALAVQRAADAASLAGVVYEPGADTTAKNTAMAESTQNGFTDGANGTVITFATPTPRELDVTISAQVPTFFSRIFGINSWTVSRTSKAVYVTPVPMGSPLAYYGVYQMCNITSSCSAEPNPPSVSVSSQGFYGAVLGEGSNRSNGDAFNPYWNNTGSSTTTVNSQYTSDGIRYEITAASNGTVYLYDPEFCATASKTGAGSGGHAGAGDHWMSFGGNPNNTPNGENTYYTLFDTHNLPLSPASWTSVAHLYELNPVQIDKSAAYGSSTFGNYSDGAAPASTARDCQSDADHNKWVALGTVTAGNVYSLQVTTSDPANPAGNRTQAFENMFSIAVSGAGSTIHGTGSMVTYANVDSGSQQFYLAQIDRTAGAGKTVEIDLFDPGDTGSGSWLQVMVDGPSGWQFATFSYTADNGRSNASTTCIQTYAGGGTPPAGCGENAGSGGTLYQNSWVSIRIALPTSYGSTGLVNNGWWQIKYTVNGASDTTTWQVSIRGNPVHLI